MNHAGSPWLSRSLVSGSERQATRRRDSGSGIAPLLPLPTGWGKGEADATVDAPVNERGGPGEVDAVVIGVGQAGLASAYFLAKLGLRPEAEFVVLDAKPAPGGAWQHRWDSLRM